MEKEILAELLTVESADNLGLDPSIHAAPCADNRAA
jgi:hypothetical protein